MATVKRRGQRKKGFSILNLPAAFISFFSTGKYGPEEEGTFECFVAEGGQEIVEIWIASKDSFLANWIQKKPGTRPAAWWEWDSPRDPELRHPGFGTVNVFPLARLIVQGHAVPEYKKYRALAPVFAFGLPKSWGEISEDAMVESEASYLRRHGLFVEGEEARLTPEDFEPVDLSSELQKRAF